MTSTPAGSSTPVPGSTAWRQRRSAWPTSASLTPAPCVNVSLELAAEIAGSAPLVVQAVKRTLARDRLDRLRTTTDHELAEQVRLLATDDAREGIAAYAERRPPAFHGR